MSRRHAPAVCDTTVEQDAYFDAMDAAYDARHDGYTPDDDTGPIRPDLTACGTGRCIHAEWDLPCPPDPWAEVDVVTCPRCESDQPHASEDGRCDDCGYQIREDGL